MRYDTEVAQSLVPTPNNEAHDSTGAQATVSAGISFARIAQACGYGLTLEGDDLPLLDDAKVSLTLLNVGRDLLTFSKTAQQRCAPANNTHLP